MIVNIRGTNGSGKSTVVREIMSRGQERWVRGAFGGRSPEAHECRIPGIEEEIYFLGPYVTSTGGCDAIHPYSVILDLLTKYAPKGHVVFEGSLVSDHSGKTVRWLEDYQQVHPGSVTVVFLRTPLEVCIKRVQDRRTSRGDGRELDPKNTTSRYHSICGVRTRMLEAGKLRVVDVDQAEAADRILEILGGP